MPRRSTSRRGRAAQLRLRCPSCCTSRKWTSAARAKTPACSCPSSASRWAPAEATVPCCVQGRRPFALGLYKCLAWQPLLWCEDLVAAPSHPQAAAPHLEVLKTSGLGSCFGVQLDAAPPRWQDLPGWPSLRVRGRGGRGGLGSRTHACTHTALGTCLQHRH